MNVNIHPGEVKGRVFAPPSKSHFIRLIASSILADGESCISFPGFVSSLADDIHIAIDIAKDIGATISGTEKEILIKPPTNKKIEKLCINCGESGLCLRVFPLLALHFAEQVEVNASGSLLNRPVGYDIRLLKILGIEYQGITGYAPFVLRKTGRNENNILLKLDAADGSQFLSGLLFYLPNCEFKTTIEVINLASRPYIDLTISTLSLLGIKIIEEEKHFIIPGKQKFIPGKFFTETDWSGASFMAVAGAIAGCVEIEGLDKNSRQADKAILEILKLARVDFTLHNSILKISQTKPNGFEFDLTHFPDLFPPVVALAFNCNGITVLKGTGRLIHKESNRALALQQEFAKLGGRIDIRGDNMMIYPAKLNGGVTESRGDHRIAMALAVAALNAENAVTINGSEAVAKSYPSFFDDFPKIYFNNSGK